MNNKTLSLAIRGKSQVLTKAFIERVSEHMQRAQLAVLNGIDPDKITQAVQAQCRLAASGDREALKFVLSMVGIQSGPSSSARKAIELSENRQELNGSGEDDWDDDDDGEEGS